jgi:hypothetical protein
VVTQDPFEFQRIGGEARVMRRLGMSLRAIGAELRVEENTVRKPWEASVLSTEDSPEHSTLPTQSRADQ